MKKKLLLLLLCAIPTIGVAQKIVVDEYTNDNTRMIACNSEIFRSFTDRLVLSLGMSALVPEGEDPRYYIDASIRANDPISAPPHARMLIKTKKGEVLNLECIYNNATEDMIGELSNINGTMLKSYSIRLPFRVEQGEINQIVTDGGVQKIRIELNGDKNYEKEWKNDKKIGKFLEAEFNLLKDTTQTNKRDSFEDNF